MSRAWYLTVLVPLAFGVIIGGISLSRMMEQIESMPRAVIPGERTFELPAGEHIIYGETYSVVDGVVYRNKRFTATCTVTRADGTPIPFESYGGKMRYGIGVYSGRAIFKFELESPGAAKVSCSTKDGSKLVIAVGEGIGAQVVVAVVGALFGLFTALAVFAIVLVKRKRYKRALAARGNDP